MRSFQWPREVRSGRPLSAITLTPIFLCDGAKLITCLAHETKLFVAIWSDRDAKGSAMDQRTEGVEPASTVYTRVADFVLRSSSSSFPSEVLKSAALQFLD